MMSLLLKTMYSCQGTCFYYFVLDLFTINFSFLIGLAYVCKDERATTNANIIIKIAHTFQIKLKNLEKKFFLIAK